jgi:hypothetical protein
MGTGLAPALFANIKRLMWIGVAASWTVFAVYFYKFAPGHWFELSADDSRWANFGTFYGGLLGPFFGFLAFIGVLLTVILQARQLDIVREQANFEEIQRVLSSLAARIDAMLASAPSSPPETFRHRASPPLTLFEFASAIGTLKLNIPAKEEGHDWLQWLWADENMRDLMEAAKTEFIPLGLEFENLAWCLSKYKSQGGNETVIEFYEYRYRAVLCWLDAVGLLDSHGQIQNYFKPKDSRQYLIAKASTNGTSADR